ncbi:MAG: bifunctional nuclease family protein, partial [Gemmatimonadota bacterium]
MSDGKGRDGRALVEVEVASLGLDKASNTPVVILREREGERLLPIWIGPGEASAIAMELAGIRFSRPLTHDLLNTVVNSLGSELLRVLITRVEENTYFASLIFRRNGE